MLILLRSPPQMLFISKVRILVSIKSDLKKRWLYWINFTFYDKGTVPKEGKSDFLFLIYFIDYAITVVPSPPPPLLSSALHSTSHLNSPP